MDEQQTVEQTQAQTEVVTEVKKPMSRLEALTSRYGSLAAPTRAETHQAFDAKRSYQSDISTLTRVSKGPQAGSKLKDDMYKEMAGIQLELARLCQKYGKLQVNLGSVMGKNAIYKLGEGVKIKYLEWRGKQEKADNIKLEAAQRKGSAINYLIEQMANVLNDQYEKAIQGRSSAEQMQRENIVHMKGLDKKLIQSLREGYVSSADRAEAEKELTKLEAELKEFDDTLSLYEKDALDAKAKGDIETVMKVTDEMTQVLEMKHQVLDAKLMADGTVSEIRRKILGSSEAVQSSKGAAAASKVNYQAINALVDSMTELQIKYKNAKEDMLPVFKIQGQISVLGLQGLDMQEALREVSEISYRLMDANANLVTHLAAETFDLLQTPLYDPEKMRVVEEKIKVYMTDLNKRKMEWADCVQSMGKFTDGSHYSTPQ